MLRGKALNVLPLYDREAQENLSKAVKLDPKLSDAWVSLGESYWKNGEVDAARNCFLGALNHVSNDYSSYSQCIYRRSLYFSVSLPDFSDIVCSVF